MPVTERFEQEAETYKTTPARTASTRTGVEIPSALVVS
jgi:hypothetical protein